MAKERIYKIYYYKGREFVIINGYGWMLYRYYSSKKSAHNGIYTVKRSFGRKRTALMRVCKTRKGYGVFQLSPKEQYRTKAKVITQYHVKHAH